MIGDEFGDGSLFLVDLVGPTVAGKGYSEPPS